MTYPNKINGTIYLDRKDSENVIVLDGTAAQYIIRNPFDFGGAIAEFSFETWMETADLNNAGTILSYAVSGDFDHILLQDYRDLELTIKGVSSGATGIAINDEIPHHIAITWRASDGATVIYIDGHERWSGTLGTGSLTDDGSLVLGLEQGSVGGTFSNGFIGEMWDARFWIDIRTQDEIYHHMNHRLVGDETGLRAYWKLDEGAGSNADDSTANNIDGTINGTGIRTTTAVRFFTDVTAYLNLDSFLITSALTHQIDTAELMLENAGAVSPSDWDEIAIYDGDLAAATRIFGGYVTDLEESEGEGAGRDFDTGCGDYGTYLDHVFIKAEYENQTDAEIIADLFETYAQQYDSSTHVETVRTHPKIRFNRVSLREIMDTLAELAQGDWYVDYERRIHFFVADVESAPFALSDDPDLAATFPYEKMKIKTDGAGVINRVEVVGGNYLSEDATLYLQGTGEDERVIMPFRMHKASSESKMKVWRNDWVDGKNYCENPSFEVNVTDFWTGSPTNCSVARDNGYSYGGAYSCEITISTGETDCAFWTDAPSDLSAGDIISTSCLIKNATGGTAQFRIGIYDGAAWDYGEWIELADTIEQRFYWTATITTGGGAFIIEAQNVAGSEIFYIDSIGIEKYPYVTAYFDGDYPETTWDGAAHNSQSTRDAKTESPFWIEITVKIGYLDQLVYGTECLHYFSERVLEATFPWPNIENAIKVFGRYEIPLRTRVRDQESFDHYKLWFDEVLNDPDITDKTTAKLAGKGIIAKAALSRVDIQCTIREPGCRSGMKIPFTNANASISAVEYFIQRVSASIGPGGFVIYDLQLGAYSPDLIDVFIQLARAAKSKPIWRDDEVLDELLEFDEVLEFTDTTHAPVTTLPPYDWAPDPSNEFDWDFGSWG